MLVSALRSVRAQPHHFLPIASSGPSVGRRRPTPALNQVRAQCGQSQPGKMEGAKNNKPSNEKTESEQNWVVRDVMSHSFGEGYSTRSDEEGFGGIYSDNQTLGKPKEGKAIHENHPEYDKKQGSEVSEKEKGRNQTEEMVNNNN